MSFDPRPMSLEDRKAQQLAHAQNMLNIISQLGSFSENPLPQYNYGANALNIGNDTSKDFAATLLLASGGGMGGNFRKSALQRRLRGPS